MITWQRTWPPAAFPSLGTRIAIRPLVWPARRALRDAWVVRLLAAYAEARP